MTKNNKKCMEHFSYLFMIKNFKNHKNYTSQKYVNITRIRNKLRKRYTQKERTKLSRSLRRDVLITNVGQFLQNGYLCFCMSNCYFYNYNNV